MDKTILHCDLNGFFASVELLSRPELRSRPVAVCGDPEKRHGIILAKNEIAKSFGVKTAETIWQAKSKCPDLALLPANHAKYSEYSRKTNLIYLRFTNRIEPFGIDESWLDVTKSAALFGSGEEIAEKIRRAVRTELGLTVSVGVSFNKIFAKLGSDMKKPDATTVISRENFTEKIYPLPVSDLLFIGRSTAASLARMGVRTIGDLASVPRAALVSRFGVLGGRMLDCALGASDDSVAYYGEEEAAKSVGNSTTFDHDLFGLDELKAGLSELADKVSGRLARDGLLASTVRLSIKTPDLREKQRQRRLPRPSNLRREIFECALELAKSANAHKYPVRLLGISASGLESASAPRAFQTDMFLKGPENGEKARIGDETVLKIREKFGESSIKFANSLLMGKPRRK